MKWSIAKAASLALAAGTVAGLLLLGPLARPRPAPKPRPPAAKAAEPARGGPSTWAIVVGIDQYQDESIAPCHGAVADARAIASWFAEDAGWGAGNVLVLDDHGEAEPGPEPGWSGRLAADAREPPLGDPAMADAPAPGRATSWSSPSPGRRRRGLSATTTACAWPSCRSMPARIARLGGR